MLHREVPPHLLDARAETGHAITLYSDVVASRPPSPAKDTSSVTATPAVTGPETADVSSRLQADEKYVSNIRTTKNNVRYTSSEENLNDLPQYQEDGQWTTVERRRAHSPGYRKKDPENPSKTALSGGLTQGQTQTVDYAIGQLTHAERQAIARRQKKMTTHRETSPSSRGEGNSKAKGKTIDPREWGGVNISHESLDLEAQAAALKSFAYQKDKSTRCVPSRQPSNGRSQSPRLLAES